ncbi:hypothetical protein [Arenicella sp. 4NH20-0111]|uniref:hypothetical protein n=1 Tax=Arenicella sp. 4NH20-0111 TaxID=3127648 RepID=UPI00333EB51E
MIKKNSILFALGLSLCIFSSALLAQSTAYIKYKSYIIMVQEGDQDGDNVYDRTDICPNTAVGDPADNLGCSAGQALKLVNCIGDLSGAVRLALICYSGESQDSDRDLIIDSEDTYPHQSALMCTP